MQDVNSDKCSFCPEVAVGGYGPPVGATVRWCEAHQQEAEAAGKAYIRAAIVEEREACARVVEVEGCSFGGSCAKRHAALIRERP